MERRTRGSSSSTSPKRAPIPKWRGRVQPLCEAGGRAEPRVLRGPVGAGPAVPERLQAPRRGPAPAG
eukprot:2035355-Lingulodinium_polyedra.AAC.1